MTAPVQILCEHPLPPLPLADRRNRVMWITPGRVFYAGLLGELSQRTMGGWLLYATLGAPLRLSVSDQPWQSGDLALAPPYQPHRVACDERLVCGVVIEPETVATEGLPAWMQGPAGVRHDPALLQRLREGHAWLRAQGPAPQLCAAGFDQRFFGHDLPARAMDARIARVLAALADDPSLPHMAEHCAASVGLSFSRFLHLFKQETGVSFRSLRSWKRARSLLHHVTRQTNLTDVALDTGYPDSTHFSHSIRQVYGLKPRDLFAGSRALTVLGDRPQALQARR